MKKQLLVEREKEREPNGVAAKRNDGQGQERNIPLASIDVEAKEDASDHKFNRMLSLKNLIRCVHLIRAILLQLKRIIE